MAGSILVGVLRALLTADTAEFESGMRKASDSAKELSKEWRTIGRQATELGTALTKTITLPIVGLGVGAVKAAMDFESSFAGVRKTVDGTEADFAKLEKQFRELAKTIPVNVNELNRLGESAGALGIPKEEVAKFVEVMAKLGVTTNLTADQAANAIGRIQNIFGAAGRDTDRLASTIVALGNAGASTETEIVEMAQRIAGAGHSVGLTQAQVASFASTLASVGINAEAGGSAISRIFLKMNDAVMAGGAGLAEFARVAGMSVGQFKTLFETDAANATVAFVNGLARLKEQGENTNGTMEGLIGKNIILKDTLNRLVGSGALLADQLAIGNRAWQENTALTEEARKRFETTESQLTLLWARVRDVGITLGNALLPAVQATIRGFDVVVPLLEKAAQTFADLPGPVQAIAIGLAGVAAAAGPLIYLFGQLALSAAAVSGAFATNGIAATTLTGTLGVLRTAATAMWTALLGPVGLIGVAVGALAALGKAMADTVPKETTQGFVDYVNSMNRLPDVASGATVAQVKAAQAAQALGLENTKLVASHDALSAAGLKLVASHTATTEQTKKAGQATAELSDEFKKLNEQFSGAGAIELGTKYEKVLKAIGGATKLTKDEKEDFAKVFDKVIEKYKAIGGADGAKIVAHYQALRATLGLTTEDIRKLNDQAEAYAVRERARSAEAVARANAEMEARNQAGERLFQQEVARYEARKQLERDYNAVVSEARNAQGLFIMEQDRRAMESAMGWRESISLLGESFSQLSTVAGGAFGEIMNQIVGVVRLIDTIIEATMGAIDAIRGLSGAMSGASGGGGGGGGGGRNVAGQFGEAAGLIYGAYRFGRWLGGFFVKEERQVNVDRDQFLNQHGGFEGLVKKLNEKVPWAEVGDPLMKALFAAKTNAQNAAAQKAIRDIVGGKVFFPLSISSHRQGTPGLGFMDFGLGSMAMLHGREAVVPHGRQAEAIEKWGGVGRGDYTLLQESVDGMKRELVMIRQDFRNFPDAVRNAFLTRA